jgi:GTP cyclohydrolase I
VVDELTDGQGHSDGPPRGADKISSPLIDKETIDKEQFDPSPAKIRKGSRRSTRPYAQGGRQRARQEAAAASRGPAPESLAPGGVATFAPTAKTEAAENDAWRRPAAPVAEVRFSAARVVRPVVDKAKIEQATRLLLEGIGEDPDREGLLDTPRRVAEFYQELILTEPKDLSSLVVAIGSDTHQEMVLVRDIAFHSFCEHHLLPFFGVADVAYVPSKNGRITGFSKIVSLVRVAAARLQLQERLTSTIADSLRTRRSGGRPRSGEGRAPLHVHAGVRASARAW